MEYQNEAERLSEALEQALKQTDSEDDVIHVARWFVEDSAAELRRLHAVNAQLLEALSEMVEMMDSGDEHGAGSPWHSKASSAIAAAKD